MPRSKRPHAGDHWWQRPQSVIGWLTADHLPEQDPAPPRGRTPDRDPRQRDGPVKG